MLVVYQTSSLGWDPFPGGFVIVFHLVVFVVARSLGGIIERTPSGSATVRRLVRVNLMSTLPLLADGGWLVVFAGSRVRKGKGPGHESSLALCSDYGTEDICRLALLVSARQSCLSKLAFATCYNEALVRFKPTNARQGWKNRASCAREINF